jgi:heme/copper-type cytochrome/quinol oxidase subunit 4
MTAKTMDLGLLIILTVFPVMVLVFDEFSEGVLNMIWRIDLGLVQASNFSCA